MASDLPALLDRLISGKDLSERQAGSILQAMAREEVSDALAGALLTALRIKGEIGAELRGFANGMRNMALRPPVGDRSSVWNPAVVLRAGGRGPDQHPGSSRGFTGLPADALHRLRNAR